MMTPRLSKFVLTTHITFSVGWLGAVVVFLALAITGVTTRNVQMAQSAYLAMELSGWFVIVPFCFASLLSGFLQSIGTKWGLFKYYWILVKLFLTIAATIVLLLHMEPISYLAGRAADANLSDNQLPGLRIQLIADAGAAVLVLLATTTLSVYKPWGKIRFGLRYSRTNINLFKKSWVFLLIGLIILILFIIKHLSGGSMGRH